MGGFLILKNIKKRVPPLAEPPKLNVFF